MTEDDLRQHLLKSHSWQTNPEGIATDDLATLEWMHTDDHQEDGGSLAPDHTHEGQA